jgi:hypothetical protein
MSVDKKGSQKPPKGKKKNYDPKIKFEGSFDELISIVASPIKGIKKKLNKD